MIRRLLIGADSLGYHMKVFLSKKLKGKNIEVIDFGCTDENDETYYPIIADRVCERLQEENQNETRAVLICGTGLGMTICANKYKGIYAAHCHDMYSCERSVLSNRANVICFGAQIISNEFAWEMLEKWLTLVFIDGRSTPKLQAIESIEKRNFNNERFK